MNTADWYLTSIPVTQLSDYQVTLSSPTGLSALNMRPIDLVITSTNSNTSSSPMESELATEPLFEDISSETEVKMLVDTMGDAQEFVNNVMSAVEDPNSLTSDFFARVVSALGQEELIQRIQDDQDIELQADPPNQIADTPIVEEPVDPVQRIERVDSDDDPLDDLSVPGQYFDC